MSGNWWWRRRRESRRGSDRDSVELEAAVELVPGELLRFSTIPSTATPSGCPATIPSADLLSGALVTPMLRSASGYSVDCLAAHGGVRRRRRLAAAAA